MILIVGVLLALVAYAYLGFILRLNTGNVHFDIVPLDSRCIRGENFSFDFDHPDLTWAGCYAMDVVSINCSENVNYPVNGYI